ncbi:DUF3857 and transglutaminase domain-containing protein [Pseudomonas sp. NBRC 111124]|uniref:DUF3857 domain-containing transglutaminase family protein n=1 Tax=Pseudomonas sp. NBRC 111124 TaxID=1661039 RepID=UPI000760D7A0
MLKFLSLTGALAFTLAGACFANALDDGTDHSITVEKFVHSFTVQPDGSFQLEAESTFRINEERAIRQAAQRALSFNHSLETLTIIDAYTQKPDGRKVVVDASQIKEQQEQISSFAPMFQDSRVKVVIYPQVAVGDRLVLRYKLDRATALFPGHFEELITPGFHPVEQFTIIYDLPAGMPLYADARGFKASAPESGNGRKVHRWDFVPANQARIEEGAVSYLDYGSYLAVSTFKDYAALASSYQARATVEVTPAIATLAEQLTADTDDDRAKALKLSDWVRKNIRYVAVYVGAGGVVPHTAQTVLNNRYGDCKDHVALLNALLNAAGIESSPALINQGNAYSLPKVATLGVLNHAVTYIPSLDLYLDSTDPSVAAGFLPQLVLNKPTILTVSGKFGSTPPTQFGRVASDLLFKIDSKGAADFTSTAAIEGWASEYHRFGVKSMDPADLDRYVEQVLNHYGQRGSGKIVILPSQGPEHFTSVAEGHTANLVNLPGPVGVAAISSLFGGIAGLVSDYAGESNRTQPFACFGDEMLEKARFEFPAEIAIQAIPESITVKDDSFDYSARYTQDGHAVVIERRIQFKHNKAVCTPEQFQAMKPAIEMMVKDLQGQIIVQG